MSSPSISGSSEEEEDEDSEDWMNMMKMMKIECGDDDDVYSRPCCEKCIHVQQSYGNETIIPEKLSRGRLQAQLEGEGTYECALTGLIFEASERVLVRYSILSWSKFNKFVQNPWMIAGPIFNVQTVKKKKTSALKYIQLPHCLCMAGQDNEKSFGVLHVTGKDPVIDTVQSSGSHLRWQVSSLSPVGAIARNTQLVENHGAVLVYEDLGCSVDTHCFRVFLASCNSSHVKDMKRGMRKGRFCAVDKNSFCLLLEQRYHLMSEPQGEVDPEYLPFTLQASFFEAYYEQPPPFTLSLKAHGSHDTAWTATIQQDDLLGSSTENEPSKRLQQLMAQQQLQLGSSDCQ